MMYSLATPIVNLHEFLSDDLIDRARTVVRDHQDKFVPTTTTTGEADFRDSAVLWHYHFADLKSSIEHRLREVTPELQRLMQEYIPQMPPTNVEVQLTNHYITGQKFKKHIDNGPPNQDTLSRRITGVIYFSMHDDNRFTDGDLIVHLRNGEVRIKPIHNSVVFFPSHIWHEVQPISSETNAFLDGRLTLNCWLHA